MTIGRSLTTICIGLFSLGCEQGAPGIRVSVRNVQSVTFSSGTATRVETSDADRLQRFSKLIEQGKSVDEHKCMEVGKLTIAMRSGPETSIGVLLGHGGNDIELRQDSQDKLLQVPRGEFLAIFELPPPDEHNPSDPWHATVGTATTAPQTENPPTP